MKMEKKEIKKLTNQIIDEIGSEIEVCDSDCSECNPRNDEESKSEVEGGYLGGVLMPGLLLLVIGPLCS